jgi:hypothetical protein
MVKQNKIETNPVFQSGPRSSRSSSIVLSVGGLSTFSPKKSSESEEPLSDKSSFGESSFWRLSMQNWNVAAWTKFDLKLK